MDVNSQRNMHCDSRHELFRKIQMVGFVLVDINLYLDTHPMDLAALNYYHKYRALKDLYTREYASQFGPLTPGTVESTNRWTWIDEPWPWQMEV